MLEEEKEPYNGTYYYHLHIGTCGNILISKAKLKCIPNLNSGDGYLQYNCEDEKVVYRKGTEIFMQGFPVGDEISTTAVFTSDDIGRSWFASKKMLEQYLNKRKENG